MPALICRVSISILDIVSAMSPMTANKQKILFKVILKPKDSEMAYVMGRAGTGDKVAYTYAFSLKQARVLVEIRNPGWKTVV